MLPAATGSVTGRRLLFPVMPAPGETLPGYLLRNVEPNFLSSIRPLLSVAGVDVALAGNCIDKLSRVSWRLYDNFGVPIHAAINLIASSHPGWTPMAMCAGPPAPADWTLARAAPTAF